MQSRIPVTQYLIGINAVIFLMMHMIFRHWEQVWNPLPLYFPLNDNFQIWQFFSYLFVHGNITHVFFNMFVLFSFGSVLERVWGSKRFLIFFFAAGVGAGIVFTAVNYVEYQSLRRELTEVGVQEETLDLLREGEDPEAILRSLYQDLGGVEAGTGISEVLRDYLQLTHAPAVGASGAIYGILVAFGLLFPNAGLMLIFLPIPIPAKYFIPGLLILDLLSGVTGFSIFGEGIAHFAHLGGALIGFVLMMLWRKDFALPDTSSVVSMQR